MLTRKTPPFHCTTNYDAPGICLRAHEIPTAYSSVLWTCSYPLQIIIWTDLLGWHRDIQNESHTTNWPLLQNVLDFIQRWETLELKKRSYFTNTISYPDHVIRPRNLKLASDTRNNIRGLKPPAGITELRSFLGLYNVFNWFGPYFSKTVFSLKQQ